MIAVGITGHQDREGLDWAFVEDEITRALEAVPRPFDGLSSLAIGADQVFAQAVLKAGGKLVSVIPAHDYETTFQGRDRLAYLELLHRSVPVELPLESGGQQAFFRAGRWIVDHADLMIAVWDGQPSKGLGGTADVVDYARLKGRPCLHINPFDRSVVQL
ncbi:hypothetical protein [Brevundimonas vesicularis]|uniref:hypothetical protein n=1 Tax=Brevundimonas vesicularis TaxID=41276 RepID=UPI0028AFE34F|nr:hypothetical protein [Brevundimonas vesicularis]